MNLSEIIVKDRIRKDMGDLTSLEKSIHKLGLLHPIVISENNELIAGQRRLIACKNLDWKEVPVTICNFSDQKQGEFDENRERMDFTVSEIRDIYDYVKNNTQRGAPNKAAESAALFTGDVRDTVAEITGIGHNQVDKIVEITETAKSDPEISAEVENLDNQKKSVNVHTLHAKVKRKKDVETQEKLELPNGQYQLIYADPPWTYGNYAKAGLGKNSAEKYTTMSIEELKELKIKELASDDSILLMWVTFPQLKESIEVMESWGFEYKTVSYTWVKKNKSGDGWFFGLGNYTRANAEICLLGVKGKGLTVKSKTQSQIIDEPITVHSEKPLIIRDKIVELFGDVKRIELFARTNADGWESWGNQL